MDNKLKIKSSKETVVETRKVYIGIGNFKVTDIINMDNRVTFDIKDPVTKEVTETDIKTRLRFELTNDKFKFKMYLDILLKECEYRSKKGNYRVINDYAAPSRIFTNTLDIKQLQEKYPWFSCETAKPAMVGEYTLLNFLSNWLNTKNRLSKEEQEAGSEMDILTISKWNWKEAVENNNPKELLITVKYPGEDPIEATLEDYVKNIENKVKLMIVIKEGNNSFFMNAYDGMFGRESDTNLLSWIAHTEEKSKSGYPIKGIHEVCELKEWSGKTATTNDTPDKEDSNDFPF